MDWRPKFLSRCVQFKQTSRSLFSTASHPLLRHLLLSSSATLPSLLRFHSLILTSGCSANPFLAAKLISLYAAARRHDLSSLVFRSFPPSSRDAFLWNSIIKTHFSGAEFLLALRLSRDMVASGVLPDQFTIPMAAASCAELCLVDLGSCFHAYSIKIGLFSSNGIGVGSSLVYMYSKCGCLSDALHLFGEMPIRDVVSWTSIIAGCVRNGECQLGLDYLVEMHRDGGNEGLRPNSRTIKVGLQACLSLCLLQEGLCLHGFSVKIGLGCCPFVGSLLLSLYSKCGDLDDAVSTFCDLPVKDIVCWTSILGVHARKGLIDKCLELFLEMMDSGIEPDEVSISCMLTGFANAGSLCGGKAFHGFIVRRNLQFDVLIANSLLDMYCKFDQPGMAEKVFSTNCEGDVSLWNMMVCGYGKMDLDHKCLDLFRRMQFRCFDLYVDKDSLVSVISSCSRLGVLSLGQSIHCYSIKIAVGGELCISNALIAMYGKCGRIDLAKKIFDQISRDVVTWNALISAFTHMGQSNEAISLFDQMILEDVKPDSTTLVSVLTACADLAALSRGKWIHSYLKEMDVDINMSLCTALIDMYAKCGQLETSKAIFDSMLEKDIVSWNVMIAGFAIHGSAKEALQIFRQMDEIGEHPNEVTFLAVLSACSHAGLVEEGKNFFSRMSYFSISPTLKHYACMVDLLGRSGNLQEAEDLVLSMPMKPDGGIWGALLGACRVHNDLQMAERVAKRALELDPENDGYYILMSNIYCSTGRWEDVERLRLSMKANRVRKRAGWSALELDEKVHVLTVGDKTHPHAEDIYMALEALCRQMEDLCYDMKRYVCLSCEIT